MITYVCFGNGRYRVLAPEYFADVEMKWHGGHWECTVEFCNNLFVNRHEIKTWCERNIQ